MPRDLPSAASTNEISGQCSDNKKPSKTDVFKGLLIGCGDTQPPIPTFADGSHLRCGRDLVDRLCVAVIDLHQNRLLAPKEHELGTSSGAYILGSARSS